jgi:Tfp pilus assembly protein PilE
MTRNRNGGFTYVELMVVLATIGMIAAMAVPNMTRARTVTQRNICIANLQEIEGVKESWAVERKKQEGDSSNDGEINVYFRLGQPPKCPGGGSYSYNPVGETPSCSIGAAAGHTL